jgi:predicted nucleic acid-binding protein
MGVVLDTSVVIAGERNGVSAADVLTALRLTLGSEPLVLSTVSVAELENGIWRARDVAQGDRRRRFVEDFFASVPSCPLTFEIARRAGRIDGQAKAKGVAIPFQDLLIGATALEFDYAVATRNPKHFLMIPDLDVKRL